jgi:hypothetical protein
MVIVPSAPEVNKVILKKVIPTSQRKAKLSITSTSKLIKCTIHCLCQSRGRAVCGVSAATCLLISRFWIPAEAWMSVLYECLLSGRGFCDWPITRLEGSYRVWFVWVWSWNLAHQGLLRHERKSSLSLRTIRNTQTYFVINCLIIKMLQASNTFTDLPLSFQGLTSERLRRFNLENRSIMSGLVVNSSASYSKYLGFKSRPSYRLSWHLRGLSQFLQKYVGLLLQIRPQTFGITSILFYYSPTIPSRDKYICMHMLHFLELRVIQTTGRFAHAVGTIYYRLCYTTSVIRLAIPTV